MMDRGRTGGTIHAGQIGLAAREASPLDGRPRDICQRTFAFALSVIKLCQELDSNAGVGRTIGWQLLKSGTSIGANLEEGQAGQSRADFVSKYAIARKEARETLYWLRLLSAAEVVPVARVTGLLAETDEIISILTAILKKCERK